MIERLVIHRFRGIREGLLENLGKVNLLIGPNNSGKTAILEMLYLGGTSGREAALILEGVPQEVSVLQATTSVRQDFLGLEPLPRLRQRHGYKGGWPGHPAEVTSEGGLAVDLKALTKMSDIPELRLETPLEEWSAKQTLKFFKKDKDRLALFSIDRQKQRNFPAALIPTYFEKIDRVETGRWHYLWEPDWVYRWNQQAFVDHFAVWSETGVYPQADRVLFFDFHMANAHFTERFANWTYQEIPGFENHITQVLGRIFPALHGAGVNIKPVPGSKSRSWTAYVEMDGRHPIEIDQFGDGVRHAFKAVAAILALAETVDEQHPGLFLWEDPELFMHPESLGHLLREVIKLIRSKPVQIVISSQSLETIAHVTNHFETEFKALQKTLRAYRLELEEGRLYAATFRYENLYSWLQQGMDPRFWGVAQLPFSYRYCSRQDEIAEEEL